MTFPQTGKLSCGCSFAVDAKAAAISPCKEEGHEKRMSALMQVIFPQAKQVEEIYKIVPALKES